MGERSETDRERSETESRAAMFSLIGGFFRVMPQLLVAFQRLKITPQTDKIGMYHGVVGNNLYPLDMDMTHAPNPSKWQNFSAPYLSPADRGAWTGYGVPGYKGT